MTDAPTVFRVRCHDCKPACDYAGWLGDLVSQGGEEVTLRFNGGAEAVFYWSQVEAVL